MKVKSNWWRMVAPEVRAQRAAQADIRQAVGEQTWGQGFDARQELIENAAIILIAISKMTRPWCTGWEWHGLLDQYISRDKAWHAFDLLQGLGLVFCDGYEDPCADGHVEISPEVLGKYVCGATQRRVQLTATAASPVP